MKKSIIYTIISFAFFIFSSEQLLAQKQGKELLDSLTRELPSKSDDTFKVYILKEISTLLHIINPDQGLKYAKEAVRISEKLGWEKGIAIGYTCIGVNNVYNNPEIAERYYRKALHIYQKINYHKGIAVCFRNLGMVYSMKNNFIKNIDYNFKALDIYEQINDKEGIAGILCNIGNTYSNIDNEQALKYFSRSLAIASKANDQKNIAYNLSNTAFVLINKKEYEQALNICNKAMIIHERLGNKMGIVQDLQYFGTIYSETKEYEKAVGFFLEGLKIAREVNDDYRIERISEKIGEHYFRIAIDNEYLSKSGTSASSYLDKAIEYLFQSIEKYEKANDSTIKTNTNVYASSRIDAYNYLSLAYQAKNDANKALYFLKKSLIAKDSTLNPSVISSMLNSYELERKNNQIQLLDKEKKLQALKLKNEGVRRNYIISSFLFLFSLSGLSFYQYHRRKKLFFQTKISETEMAVLRAQMNPHFIFNSLNLLNTYIQDSDNKTASRYLLTFSKLTRLILENSLHQSIPLAEELQALELYLSMENQKNSSKLTYTITVDSELDPEYTLIPPLMLQPFIENAILHGLPYTEHGSIDILIRKNGNMLQCLIEDNGIGRKHSDAREKPANTTKKLSLGMKIMEQRISIINKLKKSNAYVKVTDKSDEGKQTSGVRVELVLPLELRF